MFSLFSSTYGESNRVFSIYKGDSGYVSLGTLGYDFLQTRSGVEFSYPQGTWDFSDATVTGLTATATFA